MHVRHTLESSGLDHHVLVIHHHHLKMQPADFCLGLHMPSSSIYRNLLHRFFRGAVAFEGVELIESLPVGRAVEAGLEHIDDLWSVVVLLLQFLVVAAALEGIASDYEIGHLLVKLIAPPLLLRPHAFFIEVDEDDVLHMLEVRPLATPLPRHVVAVPFLAGLLPLGLLEVLKAHRRS